MRCRFHHLRVARRQALCTLPEALKTLPQLHVPLLHRLGVLRSVVVVVVALVLRVTRSKTHTSVSIFSRLDRPLSRPMCFPVWTARSPNVVFSPFGPSVCNRLGGLFGRLVVILGPLESLLDRPTAPLTLSEAI